MLTLLLSCIPSNVVATEKSGATGQTASLRVETAYADIGEQVEVNVWISDNPGIAGATLSVSYHQHLTLIGAESGEVFSSLDFSGNEVTSFLNPCKFSWDSESGEAEGDGIILTLTFAVSEQAVYNSNLDIAVSYREGDVYGEEEDIALTITNGYVTVIDYKPGDLFEDRVINTKDVRLIRQLINGNCTMEVNEAAADVNADGVINTKDTRLIRRFINGYPGTVLLPSPVKCSHTMEHSPYKAPTCTEDGNISYWYCSTCKKYFNDEVGTAELTEEQLVIPAPGHTVVIDEAVPPTPTTEGLTEGSHCSVCGEVFVAQETIPPTVAVTHEIIYDVANGDPYLIKLINQGTLVNPKDVYYEEGVGLTLKNLSVPGYRFLGWYDLAENGTLIKSIPADATEDYELYAYWSKIEYTVQYKSSLFVDRAQDTYTVDTGLVLPTPKLSNYVFTGWADEEGNLYSDTMIPVGTTGHIVLEANWTSERNKTWTKSELEDPIQYVDDNTLYFVYEIGEIQNVPLYTIKDFGYIAEGGVEKSENTTFSMTISSGTAKQIAESVEKATTSSSNWTLSSGWTDSTDISQEWLEEKGYEKEEIIGYVTSEEGNWNVSTGTNGSTDTSTGTSNEKGWSNEAKITSSSSKTEENSMNAELSSSLSAEGFGVKAEISGTISTGESTSETHESGFETGGSKTGTDLSTKNTTTSTGWSNSSSYGGSKSSSEEKSNSTSVSEAVSQKYGYGKNYTSAFSSGEYQGLETSTKGAEEWSSSVTYNMETAEEVTRSWTTEKTKAGYHRWIMAGIAHVFAVVAYDMETQSYYVYTYTVMDDKTYEYEDYSYTSATYNDHENGVISFEIPHEVAELVAEQTVYTQGLKVDQTTGKITGYSGTDNCVVIPEYMNTGDGEVVKITGLAKGVFQNNTNISAVVLSDFITEIPNDCFNGCTNLEGITGGSISKIGDRAFAGTAMVDCVVRSKITHVGENAFTGVDRVYFNCANAQVLQAADDCGAEQICIDLAYLKDASEADGIDLAIPGNTRYFEINGAGKTYTDLAITSEAAKTVLIKINLFGTEKIPAKISSEELVLNQSSISASGIALVLGAEQTALYLQSTVSISSENDNAILSKSVSLYEWNDTVDGRLAVENVLLYTGSVENQNLISSGDCEKISEEAYENMLNSYTLYFDANGGICSEESRIVANSTKIGTLPIPEREHYTFMGWYLEDGTMVTEDTVFSTGMDVTVYAKWTPVPYTVSWNTGAGYTISVSRTSSPNAGAATGALNNGDAVYYGDVLNIAYSAATGYTLNSKGSTSVTVAGNVTASTIYATAYVNSYTVSWNTGTGYTIAVNRTRSPLQGASTGPLGNNAKIYYGDVLSVTYAASTGYSLSSKGATAVTVTGNVTSATIYAAAKANSYTYNIVYKSSNGTALGSSTATYNYGTTNTISPKSFPGYNTPPSQSVPWDSTAAKTITFTYEPISVPATTKAGNIYVETASKLMYDVTIEYRNRTANSVQIRVTWTATLSGSGAYNKYGQNFRASVGSVGTGNVSLSSYGTWSSASSSARSVTKSSAWITVSLGTTNATSVSMYVYYFQTNSNGTDVTSYGASSMSDTWTIPLPAY